MEEVGALIAGGLVFWWLISSQQRRTKRYEEQAKELKGRQERERDA